MCDGVEKAPLTCPGSVIQGGGFCGCTDTCAKVEGDLCLKSSLLMGPLPHDQCDTGLVCDTVGTAFLDLFGKGKCVKDTQSKRFVFDGSFLEEEDEELEEIVEKQKETKGGSETKCQHMAYSQMMSMRYGRTLWYPDCDTDGNFRPMQCDIEGLCFCVNSTGDIQTGKIIGHVDCPPD